MKGKEGAKGKAEEYDPNEPVYGSREMPGFYGTKIRFRLTDYRPKPIAED